MRQSFAGLALLALLGGCAVHNPQDPLEPYNRGMYKVNDTVDRAVIKPVARAYTDDTPDLFQLGVGNFFGNLDDAWSTVNDALQAHLTLAASGVMRFSVNTVFGLFGVLDVATPMGLDKHPNDFGLTLARWGVPSGPYFVMPLFGPSTLRDVPGEVVDLYASPVNHTTGNISVRNSETALQFIDQRSDLLDATDLLDQIAIDPYLFSRDAYLQRRAGKVRRVRAEGLLTPAADDSVDSSYSKDEDAPVAPSAQP